jgi:hypothetical protein
MANRTTVAYLSSKARYDFLREKYGDDPQKWKLAAGASLIGADLAEGYSKWANANLQKESIARRQEETSDRADISITNIAKTGEKTKAAQAGAFLKSGVKLEGSALDVMSETVQQATEAAMVRQREADLEVANMEAMKKVKEVTAKYAPFETILGVASTAASIE